MPSPRRSRQSLVHATPALYSFQFHAIISSSITGPISSPSLLCAALRRQCGQWYGLVGPVIRCRWYRLHLPPAKPSGSEAVLPAQISHSPCSHVSASSSPRAGSTQCAAAFSLIATSSSLSTAMSFVSAGLGGVAARIVSVQGVDAEGGVDGPGFSLGMGDVGAGNLQLGVGGHA